MTEATAQVKMTWASSELLAKLETELIDRVKGVPSFNNHGFSVFDTDDFETRATSMGQSLPCFGVAYVAGEPHEGKDVTPADRGVHAAKVVDITFVVLIAIQYQYAGQTDNKPQAFDLLHQARAAVMGYMGVNRRPWRFIGERPEPAASGDGMAFYSQVWQTSVVVVGTSTNS